MFAVTANTNNEESDGESYNVPKRGKRFYDNRKRVLSDTLLAKLENEVCAHVYS